MEISGKGGSIKIQKFSEKEISKFLSGKTFTDENFPVSSFIIKKEIRRFIRAFYFFARTADDIADNKKINNNKKLKILAFFDYILKKRKITDHKVLNNIIEISNETEIGGSYARKLLKAFILDAKKNRYYNWNELLMYCKYSANPVGRFVIDMSYYIEKKPQKNINSIYQASDKLCSSLQILNHVQDCQNDFLELNRVYIPKNLITKFSCSINILKSKKSNQNFKKLKVEIIKNVENLLKDCKSGLKKIDVWQLRKETLIIFHIAQKLCYLLKTKDPLEKKIELSRIDLIFCFLKGIIGI